MQRANKKVPVIQVSRFRNQFFLISALSKVIFGFIAAFNGMVQNSGTRTNLKVGGTGLERSAGKNFFGRAPPLFLAVKAQLVVLSERFRDGQYSLVSFLFAVLLLTVPPHVQSFVKVGARAPRAPWSQRHWCKT